ncbi:hypothetical protein ACFQDZ_10620 [Sulfitobacter pacificus]|uniref:hypothetical protein n=1 Tax=Sulfitobacter pacificus TaxID=1499314 RepID=UPI00361F36C2
MSDDLDDLKSLMNAATPRPDTTRKSENIALAQKTLPTSKDHGMAHVLLLIARKRALSQE